jgi:hypothetical protein
MTHGIMRAGAFTLFIAGAIAGAAGAIGAQGTPAGPPPSVIVVTASAEVEVAPDRAHLSVAVESRGRTAAEAATANARTQTAVLSAVRRAGIPEAQLRTTALTVMPEYEHPRQGGRPTVVGYQARNSVEVEVRDLTVIGAVLDGALSAGATNVAGPRFAIADPSGVRRSALEQAVKKARADAEAIAAAAGVELGAVLEIISSEQGDRPIFEGAPMAMRANLVSDVATPVESGRLTVRASVSVRFAIQNR